MKTVRTMALLAAIGFAGCSDDPTDLANNLSQAEAEELAGIIFSNSFTSLAGFAPAQAAAAAPAMAPVTVTGSFSTTVSCPLGGNFALVLDVTGTEDDQTGAFDVTLDATQFHDGCVVQGQANQFTLTGSPSLNLEFNAVSTDGQAVDWSGDVSGSIDWLTGDRSGTCIVNLSYSGGFSGQTVGFSSSGSICGQSVATDFTFSG